MKINHFNIVLIFVSIMMPTGCLGHCADWNCNKLNPRWKKRVDNCENRNFSIIKQKFGYKDGVAYTEIGQHASGQCITNGGRYDIRKDKQYGHLFTK